MTLQKEDEDPWGDANNDGILDDDGDCLALGEEFQDSDGDGTIVDLGTYGVDEDYSEQFITDLVNMREIYLIPLLNVDGAKYDHEVWVPAPATEESLAPVVAQPVAGGRISEIIP